MIKTDYKIVENGDSAITIIFTESIGENLSSRILQLVEHIKISLTGKFENIIPAYQSLTLCYKPLTFDYKELNAIINSMLAEDLPPSYL